MSRSLNVHQSLSSDNKEYVISLTIHQSQCRTQWPRVGNNIDHGDNRFVYDYVTQSLLKGQGHVMETNFFRNHDFAIFLIGHITAILNYFSQNESVILKMDSCIS